MTNRSEIVQSKYGLHHVAEAADFRDVFARLLADAPPIAIGAIRWLHDNPHLHGHASALLGLLDHDHADVVFETLQCLRVAKLALSAEQLEPLLEARRHGHPRMIAAGIEHLELWPASEAHGRAHGYLRSDDPAIAWAAARTLLRAGTTLEERLAGAELVATRLRELEGDAASRQLLRAYASVDAFGLYEPLLRASESPSFMKVVAAALSSAMLGHDDVRLLGYLRRFRDAFGLDPPYGLASYLLRHGNADEDRDAVFGAQGATDPRAGYEAKAVLARWGDAGACRELERALAYATPAREAAFEAWFRVLEVDDWPRLDVSIDHPQLSASAWTVLCANLAGPHPASREWIASLAAFVRSDWSREAKWSRVIEVALRSQIPSKFEVGAVSADFGVLAELLPNHFRDLVGRCVLVTPDRLGVDLFEWLAVHRADEAHELATLTLDSPHWGVRQCARRISR